MSSASVLTKACKESPLSNRFMVQLPWKEEVPDWCTHRNRGDLLSFVARVRVDNNICGIILCANTSDVYDSSIIIPKIYTNLWKSCMCVMYYPLDDTTHMVESGDSVAVVVVLDNLDGLRVETGFRMNGSEGC